MATDIDKWLQQRERESQEELAHHEREAEKRRGALDMIRRWRADLARTGPPAPEPASEPSRNGATPSFDEMPDFSEATDPTGKRRAIWALLDERRGHYLGNKPILSKLIRQGSVPPDTEVKDIAVTTSRMAKGGQIHKGGRGAYGLPLRNDAADPSNANRLAINFGNPDEEP
jgi:hypothetical protein